MTQDSNYWVEPGHTTMPRVVELANWLTNERGFCKNNGYGRTYIENACAEFDTHSGAFMALLSAGYLKEYPDRSYEQNQSKGVWWTWNYQPHWEVGVDGKLSLR